MTKYFDSYIKILLMCTVFFVGMSLFFLKPVISGDGVTYVDSMYFLETGQKTIDFFPNRLITTIAPLEIIIFLGNLFGSKPYVWISMNIFFYAITSVVFYRILYLVFERKKVAFLGVLFLIGNYAMISFGLNYLMDMGGWMFYIISLFYVLRYAQHREREDIIKASMAVGIGGMFKEYALLGVIPIACFLIYENKKSFTSLIRHSILPACISVIPIVCVYVLVYMSFDYTYADWIKNSYQYAYSASFKLRIIEYIKSLGSLYNILGVFVVGGAYVFLREYKNLNSRIRFFIVSVVVSFLPVFLWGGVTQRILFITVPALILVSCFLFKKYEYYFYIFITLCGLYAIINFMMDSFLLKVVNLPF